MLDADLRARQIVALMPRATPIASTSLTSPMYGPASGRSCRASELIQGTPRTYEAATILPHVLGKHMIYSCHLLATARRRGTSRRTPNLKCLPQARARRPGPRCLEIGCGWGGFAKYAAENTVSVVGVT